MLPLRTNVPGSSSSALKYNAAEDHSLCLFSPQAGTPKLTVRTAYDAAAKTFTLECSQKTPPTPGQDTKVPALVPIAVGLLGAPA